MNSESKNVAATAILLMKGTCDRIGFCMMRATRDSRGSKHFQLPKTLVPRPQTNMEIPVLHPGCIEIHIRISTPL